MLLNIVMILVILGMLVYIGYKYYISLSDIRDDDFFDDDYTDVITLKDKISKEFSGMLKENFREKNMSKKELENKQKSKAVLRRSLKEAAYGNAKAKRNVKLYIKNMLLDQDLNLGVNEQTIDEIIPFNKYDELKDLDKFEIMMYVAYNILLDDDGKLYKQNGFARIIKDYNLLDPVKVNGEWMYDFTSERLDYVFRDLMKRVELTFNDKLEILSQRIFELYKGFGAVDTIFDTGVDEIDAGLSGIPKDGYEITNSAKNLTFSYQSIWIMVGGIKLRLSCLSFGSQEELIRVVNNIYKFGANKVLSKKSGFVVSTMKNGSRIVVMRPPFANSYAFLARKFDSTPSIAPEDLIKGNNAIIPLTLIKWLIKGQRTIGITGSQGTGKSTLLKSIIRFIDSAFSIRVQEISAELNLNYAYPNRNILGFQETESITSQEGLNFQKKTSGDINIIGEVAEAIQANYVVQTAMVASLFALFTHHAKTAYDLVMDIANKLLDPVVGIYREKKEAVEMAAKILNIDLHLENRKGHRFLERITEIIPVTETLYPSELDSSKTHEDDELEYWKRITDRKPFDERDLVRYVNGEFVLVNLPSEAMINEIKKKLTEEEEEQFMKDMEMIRTLPRKPVEEDVFEEKAEILDPDLFEMEPVES
ncbi:MAG: ATPase, T2SS/T4P/T4SS family [Lachnospiraceae bacterium]|nr:ATPase, T2SS/T4P/T4SS family [Lachnospiraceae bacterium]